MLISKLNACFCPHFPAVLNCYYGFMVTRRKETVQYPFFIEPLKAFIP